MTEYKYETHLHTTEVSACASCPGADYIPLYKSLGYSGIIVTDHFFNGNCAIPKNLSWTEKVERFCQGYENAKEAGDKAGLSVFFGWEANFECDEYLIYGLDKPWLLEHPQIMQWTRKEQFEQVSLAGGCVVQAHPFRERDYISKIRLYPSAVHALEVCNGENPSDWDRNAYRFAQENNLSMTSGSDVHHDYRVGPESYGMAFDHPLDSIHDYVHGIISGSGYSLIAPKEKLQPCAQFNYKLEVEIND